MLKGKNRFSPAGFSLGFKTIYKSGVLAIKSKKNELDYPRAAVIISKKVAKTAVLRNKIKRTVFDFLGERFVSMGGTGRGSDFLIILSGKMEKSDNIKGIILKELRNGFTF